MAKLTKQEYEELKNIPKEYLTQEDLNDIHEFEISEAGAPSEEDLEWSRTILNEKNPRIQELFRKNGDLDKAISIQNQKRNADDLMLSKGQSPHIRIVKSTPEDVVKKGGYKFNWRNAYENVKGEKLRATEADAKKLQEFINSNMYDVDDEVKLKQIAYNLHMYNPNTMKWADFINSEQGEEFKKYLEDVRNTQTEKAVEDIWEGKEPSQQWTPFGYKEVPGAMTVTDFMLPVSKEYAKNHFNDEDFSIAGPLATDVAANLVMTGTGALPATKLMNKPLVSYLYGNVAAPAITETGNVAFNDESIPEALVRTGEGTAINIGTPQILEGMLSRIGRGLPNGNNRSVQKIIDEATNKAENVYSKINEGTPYPVKRPYYKEDDPLEFLALSKDGKVRGSYSTDPAKSNENWGTSHFKSVKEMPGEAITDEELEAFYDAIPFSRSRKDKSDDFRFKFYSEAQDDAVKYIEENFKKLLEKKAESLLKHGDLRNLTPSELRQLGFPNKESFMNWLIRSFKNNVPETVKTYLTNASGRPEFGREAGPIENINRLLGTSFFQKDNTKEEKQKSRIQRILGM